MLFQAYFGDTRSVIYTLEQMGLTDVILPFILIFTTLYAVMSFVKVFQDKNKYKIAISLAITLLVLVPHITGGYPDPQYDPINIINQMMPGMVVIIMAVLLLFILLGFFYGKEVVLKDYAQGIATLAALGAVFFIFANAIGWLDVFPPWLNFLKDPQLQAVVIVLLVFGLIVFYVTREDTDQGEGAWKKMKEGLKGLGRQFGQGGTNNT